MSSSFVEAAMAEERIMIGFPIVLILAVLVIAGIVWIFHHHHWRPFAGIFLFVIGLGAFFILMRSSVHMERQQAPQPAPRFSDAWQRGDNGASAQTGEMTIDGRSTTMRDSTRNERHETLSDKA